MHRSTALNLYIDEPEDFYDVEHVSDNFETLDEEVAARQLIPTDSTDSGSIVVTVEENTRYTFTGVTSLTLHGDDVDCYGTITFASSTPSVTVDSFESSDGDDITEAAASEVWEFNCVGGRVIWKNWSAV